MSPRLPGQGSNLGLGVPPEGYVSENACEESSQRFYKGGKPTESSWGRAKS